MSGLKSRFLTWLLIPAMALGLAPGCTTYNPATGQKEIDYGATAGLAGAAMGAAALGVALSNNDDDRYYYGGPGYYGGGGYRYGNVNINKNVNINNNYKNIKNVNRVNKGNRVNRINRPNGAMRPQKHRPRPHAGQRPARRPR